MRQNSEKFSWKFEQKSKLLENIKILDVLPRNAKKFDTNLLKYWGRSGAKACKSCRSHQELPNEYLLAKFGFDTAENEPLKVRYLNYFFKAKILYFGILAVFSTFILKFSEICTQFASEQRGVRRTCPQLTPLPLTARHRQRDVKNLRAGGVSSATASSDFGGLVLGWLAGRPDESSKTDGTGSSLPDLDTRRRRRR